MKQRILSMILVAVMVFTSVDITAFAQENIGVEVATATEEMIEEPSAMPDVEPTEKPVPEEIEVPTDIPNVEESPNAIESPIPEASESPVPSELPSETDIPNSTEEPLEPEPVSTPESAPTPSIEPSESPMTSETPEGMLSDTGINSIVEFVPLSQDATHIYLSEKIPLDELNQQLPRCLDAILDSGETVQIDVEWVCDVDYENEIFDEYTFYPVWNRDEFPLNENSIELFTIPYIYVFVDIDILSEEIQLVIVDATDSSAMDFEVYLANYYLDYGEYYVFDYNSPYRTFVDELRNRKAFQNSLYGWRALTFDLSSEAAYSQKEYAYCQMILFDVLYEGEGFPDVLGNVQNEFKRINASAWKKICKLDASLTKTTKVDPDKLGDLYNQLEEIEELSGAMDVIDNLDTYVGYIDNVYDVVEKVAKVQAILDLPGEIATILKEMGMSSSSYPPLYYALEEFSTICSGSLTTEQITLLFSNEVAINEITKELLGAVWKEVMASCGQWGLMIQAGQAMGKLGSNLLFSTDKTIETYYTLENLYMFEDVLKSKVRTYATAFQNNPTIDNARKFNTAVQLLYSTYKVGIDYAVDFVEVVYGDGLINQIYRTLNNDEYEDMKESLYFIQDCFRRFFDHSEEIAYNSYLEEYGGSLNEEFNEVVIVDITPIEFNNVMVNVEIASAKLSNFNVTKNLTLTGDILTYGNLYVKSGVTLNLNGYTLEIGGDAEINGNLNLYNGTLKIKGNVLHSGGTVTFNQGELLVGGDYRIQDITTNSAGETSYTSSSGILKMKYEGDLMEVGGDFITQSNQSYYNLFSAGTMKFAGDVKQIYYTSGQVPFQCTGSHKVILNGTEAQRVSIGNTNNNFNELEIQNENVIFSNYIGITKLVSDGTVASEGAILENINLNGYTLSVNGDVKIKGNIDLQGGKLEIKGNVLHSGGTVTFNQGELLVGGDYRIQDITTNSAGETSYTSSSGILKMKYEGDLMEVGGDFITQSNQSYYNLFSAGTMKFAGDVKQIYYTSGQVPFQCTGSHKVILNGTEAQRVSIGNTNNNFNELEIQNENVIFSNYIRITKLVSDGTVASEGAILENINLNGYTLSVNGDVEIADDIDLKKGMLQVTGNVLHTEGAVTFNKGKLLVDGDYRIQKTATDSAGDPYYTSSNGALRMQYADDQMEVTGDFITDSYYSVSSSSSSNLFSAGTMKLGGDISQLDNGSSSNFRCSGAHKVILTGTEKQKISFASTSSYFNILELTQKIDNYEFSPNPCWQQLITVKIPVEEVLLDKETLQMDIGDTTKLIAQVLPTDADEKEVIWSSNNANIASVDENGLVTAVSGGTTQIIAEAGSIKAICEVTVISYTVFFDSQEGKEVAPIENVKKGSTIVLPEPPTRDGYTFGGWYTEPGGLGTVFDAETVVNENITVYAKWIEIEVELETLGMPTANVPSESTVVKGDEIVLSCDEGAQIYYTLDGTNPTKESYLYAEAIVILEDTVIKAIAMKEGFNNSEVVTFTYYVDADAEEDGQPDVGEILPEDMPIGGIEEIPEGLWIAGVEEEYIYTGKDIKPEVRVYDYKTMLKEKKDYIISYKNTKKANDASNAKTAPTITVTGKGNYTSKATVTFKILKKDISDVDILTTDITVAYNKKSQKKVPTVTRDGKKLVNKTDFTVSYPDLADNPSAYKVPGTYTILVKGKGSYTGEREVKLTITESKLMSKVTVSKIATQPYTGVAVTTATMKKVPTVKYGKSTVLQEGIHYTVSYENNIEIGTATMILTGTETETPEGTFAGIKQVTFKIGGTSLKGAVVTGVPKTVIYTGQEINDRTEEWGTPIKVIVSGKELVRAENEESEGDYTVTYKKNVNKGTATVTIKGVNAYSGSIKKEFTIAAYNINDAFGKNLVTETMEKQTVYAKGGSKPEPVVKFGETTLVKGTDYTLTYANNTKWNDGISSTKIPFVTIKGKGNFKGSVTLFYTIAKQDIGNMNITVPDVVYKKKKGVYKSKPVIKDINSKTLKEKTDYSNVYTYTYGQDVILANGTVRKENDPIGASDIVPADTLLRVTVTGKGNYTNETPLVGEYRVVKSSISKAKVTIPSQTYTGNPITLDKSKITVKVGKNILKPEEFEIVDGSYANNTKKGTASVTIKGLGNYGGTKKVTFKIKAKGLSWWQNISE